MGPKIDKTFFYILLVPSFFIYFYRLNLSMNKEKEIDHALS